ncbi:hypothetical protein DICA3_E28128 [Diutina catenulata]
MTTLGAEQWQLVASLLDYDSLDVFVNEIRHDPNFRDVYHALTRGPITLEFGHHPVPEMRKAKYRDISVVLSSDFREGMFRDYLERNWPEIRSIDWQGAVDAIPPQLYDMIHRVAVHPVDSVVPSVGQLTRLREILYKDLAMDATLDLSGLRELKKITLTAVFDGPLVTLDLPPSLEEIAIKNVLVKFKNSEFPSLRAYTTNIDGTPIFPWGTSARSFPELTTIHSRASPGAYSLIQMVSSQLKTLTCPVALRELPQGLTFYDNLQKIDSPVHTTTFPPGLQHLRTNKSDGIPDTVTALHLKTRLGEDFTVPASVTDFSLEGTFHGSLFNTCGNLTKLSIVSHLCEGYLDFGGETDVHLALENLEFLEITGYRLDTLVVDAPVETLRVTRCGLRAIEVPQSVREVDLSHNKLTEVPVDRRFTRLLDLNLSHNALQGPKLELEPPNLETVELGSPELTELKIPRSLRRIDRLHDSVREMYTDHPDGKIHLLINQSPTNPEASYVYDQRTTRVELHVTRAQVDHNPSLLELPTPLTRARLFCESDCFGLLDDSYSIRVLEFHSHDGPTEDNPVVVPSSVESLEIAVTSLANDTAYIKVLGETTKLRELFITGPKKCRYQFVGTNQPRFRYFNGERVDE